jgi:hypothetical protein
MKRRNTWTRRTGLIAGAVTGALALAAASAFAANCGGATACACGDTVTSSWTFDRNLTCGGTGPGLIIGANSVVLDGVGTYSLTGTGSGQNHKGIKTQGFDNTTIKRLDISGFNWGINVEGGATGTLIDDVTVHANLDEGIHLGSNSSSTTIQNSVLDENATENLYVLESDNNTITGNIISGTNPSASIYNEDSDNNTYTSNDIQDRLIQVLGSSTGNCFGARDGSGNCVSGANDLTSARFQFAGTAHDNNVIGASISSSASCVQFTDSSQDNFVRAVLLSCQSGRDIRVSGSGTNVFHKGSCSNADPSVLNDGTGSVTIQCCSGCC